MHESDQGRATQEEKRKTPRKKEKVIMIMARKYGIRLYRILGQGTTPGKVKVEKIDKISELPKEEFTEVRDYLRTLVEHMDKMLVSWGGQ